ncbi:MAG TPA: hydroxymethylbilane synthase [Chitinophagaceae bacterium]|nr:hydroxymethylbilane synthase [Chitinophagaceae bacterium]
MGKLIRIGTRESQLALWQATQVKALFAQHKLESELVFIKSEGDIDLVTPLYEIGVQGIFTRSLDAALLSNRIDVAVHSLKDVPTQLPNGIVQAAVLKRGEVNDLLVFKNVSVQEKYSSGTMTNSGFAIATSSIRRKAQWLNKFPDHVICNLRGNVNTRLRKLREENWDAAIFAQAGLERIGLRPAASVVLDWMLPAPAQGAIAVVCRQQDQFSIDACSHLNDAQTEICTKIERDFLRRLLGGCSTPISALAEFKNQNIFFRGHILSLDGSEKVDIEKTIAINDANNLGRIAAEELLSNGGQEIAENIRHAAK